MFRLFFPFFTLLGNSCVSSSDKEASSAGWRRSDRADEASLLEFNGSRRFLSPASLIFVIGWPTASRVRSLRIRAVTSQGRRKWKVP